MFFICSLLHALTPPMAKFIKVEQKLPKHGRVTRAQLAETAERFDHRGRGAISNPTGRYEPETRSDFDDGWDTVEDAPPPLRTELTGETARTIITFNRFKPRQSIDIRIRPSGFGRENI